MITPKALLNIEVKKNKVYFNKNTDKTLNPI